MSTDRELLGLAAKAAGIRVDWGTSLDCGSHRIFRLTGTHDYWNPLADDGDALRLAVKLGIRCGYERNAPPELGLSRECGVAIVDGKWFAEVDRDPQVATRRAIVRAAAAMASL